MKFALPAPDKCIACTTCTVFCPVAQATPNFLGPRMIGPAHERFRLSGIAEDASLHYCSNCKNCDISCPCGVPISTFLMKARAEVAREGAFSLRDWLLAHGEVVARWLRYVPASLKNFGMGFSPSRALLQCAGVAKKAPLPPFAVKAFFQQFAQLSQPVNLPRTVVFFPGCFVGIYDPQCGMDVVRLLNMAGYKVIVPPAFVCCGLPLVANGFWDEAKSNAAANLAALREWQETGVPVLTGCTSCSLMFTAEYAEYFPELVEQSAPVAVGDVCEFLLQCLERGELAIHALDALAHNTNSVLATAATQKIIYHAPCHLRAQGIGMPGLALLKKIPDVEILNADAGCCGISGSYGFKDDKYAIAMRVGARLFSTMRESGVNLSASECGTCRVQMQHGSGLRAVHPATVLLRALQGEKL